jgi:GT2 family glycosyltransferase
MRKKFKKMKNPKVSIISPIHNRERFLIRFLKNIQSQNFYDIEIILVDDKSTDNGINILEEYQREDKRIKIITNKKNKGTFIARNIGVLYSQGKYIIIQDLFWNTSGNVQGSPYIIKSNPELIKILINAGSIYHLLIYEYQIGKK